jgi:predicted transposase/invertase (TIGR01784 family)
LHVIDPATQKSFDTTEIFPEYFFISIPQFDDRLEHEIDDWLYVMKHDNVPTTFHSPYMQKVVEKLSVLKMTVEERNHYFNYKKKLCDEKEELKAAEARGEARGEANTTKIIAKRMFEAGFSIEEISKATMLPTSEILQL